MSDIEATPSGEYSNLEAQQRPRTRANRQATGNIINSPSNRLDEYFAPRKSQRLAAKNAKDVFKVARQRGGSSNVPPLSGYLGTIPQEVRLLGIFAQLQSDQRAASTLLALCTLSTHRAVLYRLLLRRETVATACNQPITAESFCFSLLLCMFCYSPKLNPSPVLPSFFAEFGAHFRLPICPRAWHSRGNLQVLHPQRHH